MKEKTKRIFRSHICFNNLYERNRWEYL